VLVMPLRATDIWLTRTRTTQAANLLVDRNWTVKVADFGLSVVKKDAAAKKEKHGPIGTPLWMAPEVLMNKEYNEKADVVRCTRLSPIVCGSIELVGAA
jgi:serine/threonine protein kinase